jgi:ketosteroid isomerase-like protein
MTTSTERGDSSIMDGKFMSVLKKQSDGRWLLFRDCFNSNIPVL